MTSGTFGTEPRRGGSSPPPFGPGDLRRDEDPGRRLGLALTGRGIDPLEVVGMQIERVQEQLRRQQKLLDQLRHVSKLMKGKKQVSVDDFTTLLQAMKNDYEKPILNRQQTWEQRFGLLGMFLAGVDEKTNHKKEENKED